MLRYKWGDALDQAVAARFAPPGWALLWEVHSGTGYVRTLRSADAVAMSLWPSRGLELHGMEMKRSRGDWIKELHDPEKAEEIAKACHRWWVVVSDPKIVAPGELPPAWGLLALHGKALRVEVQAPELKPEPIKLPLVAAILRRAAEAMVPRWAIEQEKDESFKRGIKVGESDAANHRIAAERLCEKIKKFQEASGIDMMGWEGPERIGQAVKVVLENGTAPLRRLREAAERIISNIDRALEKDPEPATVEVDSD